MRTSPIITSLMYLLDHVAKTGDDVVLPDDFVERIRTIGFGPHDPTIISHPLECSVAFFSSRFKSRYPQNMAHIPQNMGQESMS
jgi:hypothetical protein